MVRWGRDEKETNEDRGNGGGKRRIMCGGRDGLGCDQGEELLSTLIATL